MSQVNKKVTIKDVAKLADVTAQTVSRVMRKKGYVSSETEKKVMEAAHRLNYVPSYAAKALRTGMSKSIAFVFDSLKNIYFAIMINHLHTVIRNYGYSVQLIFSYESVITEDCYRRAISHGAVAVISFIECSDGLGATVTRLGVPLMVLGRSTNEAGVDYITTDDKQGGRIAAKYLIENGCKSFYYAVEGLGMTCALDRYEGFTAELAEHGFKAELADIGTYGDGALSAIDLTDPGNGMFCFNDTIAFHILNKTSIANSGSHIKLVGYDNLKEDIELPVSLASVGIDKNEYAAYVIKSIIEKINTPEKSFAEHCPVKLYG